MFKIKKIITVLSILTFGTSVPNLISNVNNNEKTELININSKQNINIENSTVRFMNKEKTVKDGKNYYEYYFAYHVIWLNHDALNKLNSVVGAGIGGFSTVLCSILPSLSRIASPIAAVLIFQWYIWQIPSYDNGSGVVINMIGLTPTWIVNVLSQ